MNTNAHQMTRKRNKIQYSCNKDDFKLDFVECTFTITSSFNAPRITARLENLMGTNVVRLTDRVYMHQLRQNLEADSVRKLQERIEKREAQEKERHNYLLFRRNYTPENCPRDFVLAHSIVLVQEMERERNLIMQGKTQKIPEGLKNYPVFVVNERTNNIITKRRSKLKTNREKNAERLIRQGAKWERDRLVLENLEREKELEMKARKEEQSDLENQFRDEDAIRGIDLLRIHNRDWKVCELDLKKFLETEKALMKQRSLRKSVQYTSDPLDVQKIVCARKKFRDTERKIRQKLDKQFSFGKQVVESKDFLAQTAAGSAASRKIAEQGVDKSESKHLFMVNENSEERIPHSDDGIQTDEDLSNDYINDEHKDSEIDHEVVFQKEMESDIQQGSIMTKEQFDLVHYEDPLIALLKKTDNVQDLYKVAKDIIVGEAVLDNVDEDEV